jgi:hypothetical protein
VIDLNGAAHHPCSTAAVFFGDIDFTGTIFIQFSTADPSSATVAFNGLIEPFPAYEMYATVNDGAGLPLFQIRPKIGVGPASITGPPNIPASGSTVIHAS